LGASAKECENKGPVHCGPLSFSRDPLLTARLPAVLRIASDMHRGFSFRGRLAIVQARANTSDIGSPPSEQLLSLKTLFLYIVLRIAADISEGFLFRGTARSPSLANFASSLLAPGIHASRVVDYALSREPLCDIVRCNGSRTKPSLMVSLRNRRTFGRGLSLKRSCTDDL